MTDNENPKVSHQPEVRTVNEKLQQAIRKAAEPLPPETKALEVGEVFVLRGLRDSVGVSWLVANEHPDDPALLLCVPLDSTPFVGPVDVRGPDCQVARVNSTTWLPIRFLPSRGVVRVAVGAEWDQLADECRLLLGRLAAGKPIYSTPDQLATDEDPHYHQHERELDGVVAHAEQLYGGDR